MPAPDQFLTEPFPEFTSVYDHIVGYGRTKSLSYRLWKGARRLFLYVKVVEKSQRKRYRVARDKFHNLCNRKF